MTSSTYRYIAYRRRRRNGHGMPKLLMALIVLAGTVLIGMAVMAGTGYGVYQHYADELVPPDVAIAKQPSGGARILDRKTSLHGWCMQRWRVKTRAFSITQG
jgi:hypothetical protein